MNKNKLVYLLVFVLCLGFYSCNNEDEFLNNQESEASESSNVKYLSLEDVLEIAANITDTTVYYIDTEQDLNQLLVKVSKIREQELLNEGFVKVEKFEGDLVETRSGGVEFVTKKIHPMGTTAIPNSQFKGKFSQAFCNEINARVGREYQISPNKTYICGWRDAGTYHKLRPDQQGVSLDSPKAALQPSTKSQYMIRGCESYVNGIRQLIMSSHQLAIDHEDVKNPTIIMDIRYPFWDSSEGYLINYAILTE